MSIWSILEPIIYERPMHLAEISKRLKKPHSTVRNHLALFERMGIVSKEKMGKQIFYSIKRVSLLVDYLTIVEKERLVSKCQGDRLLKEIVEELHVFHNPIIMFGSAVDSSRKAEDIDLLIIGKFDRRRLKPVENRLNVRFHVISVRNFDEVGDSLRYEIRKKHLIVNCSEEMIKWLIS